MTIRKNDNVIILTGGDKGKKAKVLKVFPRLGKLVVEGVNIKKKHKKPVRGAKGSMVELAMPINISNVMLLDGNKPTRAGVKMVGDKKVRISRKSSNEI